MHHQLACAIAVLVAFVGGCQRPGDTSSTQTRRPGDNSNNNAQGGDDTSDDHVVNNADNDADNSDLDMPGGENNNDGDNDAGGPVTLPPNGCEPLAVQENNSVGNFMSDVYQWRDSACKTRTAAMVRNSAQDPSGKWGGYMRRYTYEVDGATRSCQSSNNDHPGFGYLVNHVNGGSVSSRRNAGSHTIKLKGRHHAIHQYAWTYNISGKPVTATVHWMFATGRDHPLWAVTFNTQAAGANGISADSRAPYGDIDWDGGAHANVAGVGWGDRYKFTSLGGPITLNSGWDYTQANTIPYVTEWAQNPDAEMGLVQTQTYVQHDAGGYGFYSGWGKRDDNGPMPADYNWPYQLNQYELPWGSTSKRLAWGMNYGAVGQTSYPVFGNDGTASGYPYQSYSVFVVLDKHSKTPVAQQVVQMEIAQDASLTAQKGTVKTLGPAGLARTDTITYDPPGYNPVYSTWELQAAANELDATLSLGAEQLQSPVFVVRDWTRDAAPTTVTLNGRTLVADVDYYASLDATEDAVWLTLAGAVTGTNRVTLK